MEDFQQKGTMQISMQVDEIMKKAMRQIQETTEAITFLYHAGLHYSPGDFSPLQTDSLPFVVGDTGMNNDPDITRINSFNWLFKRAFENFITGLTESLIETHKFVKNLSLSVESKEKAIISLEEINNRIATINSRPHKLPFPALIEEIEEEIKQKLFLRQQVISINNIRNCLVHRNGIVSPLDTKYEPDNKLRLQYVDLVTLFEKGNEMVEMKWQHKQGSLLTSKILLTEASKLIEFSVDSHVQLDQNVFNGAAYTCVQFVKGMFETVVAPHLQMPPVYPQLRISLATKPL